MDLIRKRPHFDELGFISVRKKPGCCLQRVFPLLLAFSLVTTLAMFLVNYSRIMEAHTGKCLVTGFIAGTSCTECTFAVDVGASNKNVVMAEMRVEADYDGDGEIAAKMNAFSCCPKQRGTFNCCNFGPTPTGHFCDALGPNCQDTGEATRWDCTYSLSPNTTDFRQVPYDIREGTISALYNPVLIALAVFVCGGCMLLCVIKQLILLREKQIAHNRATMSKQTAALQAQRDAEEEAKRREMAQLAALCQRLRDTTQAAGSHGCFEKDPLHANFRRVTYKNSGALEDWPINTPKHTPQARVSTRTPASRSTRSGRSAHRKQLHSLSPTNSRQEESTLGTQMAEITLEST